MGRRKLAAIERRPLLDRTREELRLLELIAEWYIRSDADKPTAELLALRRKTEQELGISNLGKTS